MAEEAIEKTFQVTAPARLIIANIRGSIHIQPGSQDVIRVTAVKHGSFDTGKYSIEMSQETDGTVRVETRLHEAMFGFLTHPPKVDYEVSVPQEIHLDASCVSSTIAIRSLSGIFKLKTVSGDVELEGLSGSFKINAVSGDISGTRLSGTLEAETVSGRVRLLESSFPSANASSVSGDLILQTPLFSGPYDFGSVSGNVRMLVPADTHCNAELKSVSGSIRSSLPSTSSRLGHGLKVTQIQGGGVAIRLKSVSGSLSLETQGVPATAVPTESAQPEAPFTRVPPLPPIPPIPPMPPFPSDAPTAPEPGEQEVLSTAEILQRIERGEMTVDEAIRHMKGQS